MPYQVNGCSKLCGTCEYWIGQRMPNYFGSHVELESQSEKGRCYCWGGPFLRSERYSNSTACSCYKKWAVLR